MVFLIPSYIADDAKETIPAYILDAVMQCQVFFVENERTARRFLKSIWKEMVIDAYEWHSIHKVEEQERQTFIAACKADKNIGIISEAGCPGVADPGQILVQAAQQLGFPVKPLVGPSSILLALMASGLNGQQFQFIGYLPIDHFERAERIKFLEAESKKKNCTQIFIETPYRNDVLLGALLESCAERTHLCVATDLSLGSEEIKTQSIAQWRRARPAIGKRPTVFLLLSVNR